MAEISNYEGRPVIVLNPGDPYPFSIGYKKAKMILQSISDIEKFVEQCEDDYKKKNSRSGNGNGGGGYNRRSNDVRGDHGSRNGRGNDRSRNYNGEYDERAKHNDNEYYDDEK